MTQVEATAGVGASAARALDAADPLRAFRDRFVDRRSGARLPRRQLARPTAAGDGRAPRAGASASEWGGELVRGWDHWLDEPVRVGERIGLRHPRRPAGRDRRQRLDDGQPLQARRGGARRAPRPDGRSSPRGDEFPTDRYVLEGLADRRGLDDPLARRPTRSTARRPPTSRRSWTPTSPSSSCRWSTTARRRSPTWPR